MTHTATHTPGPWVLQPIRDGEKVIRYSIWKEPTESPEDVVGSAYSLPNAHLIAAAPAMYEALKNILALQLDCDGVTVKLTEYHCHQVREAQAALAQAEGNR